MPPPTQAPSAKAMADLSIQPDSEAALGTPGDGPPPANDQFPYGLEVLHEPTPPPLHLVQIIFVHGLNGSKRRTWTHGKTDFWPLWLKELEGMEGVRLATFGYNSSTNILKPNTNLSIPTFAGQLLRYLTQLSYKNGSVSHLTRLKLISRLRRFSLHIAWEGWS